MAGKSTISITFKLDGDNKGFKELTKDADGLKAALQNTISEAKQLKGNVINFAALSTGFSAISSSVQHLQGMFDDLTKAYAVQESAEKRLETVMRQRMSATDDEIQSVKDLASAQQALGVIGDEVQLSGVQQLSTFLNHKSSIDTLLPAMNNLIAQQKGYSATTQDAVNIGNLIGKAMQGQTAALRRVGITFDETEEKVLKYGTESERAAMMAQVITNNVGNMNAALANTDSGRLQQVVNTLGDYKEQLGGMVKNVQPYLTIAAQATTAASGVGMLVTGVKTLTAAMTTNLKAFALSTAAYVKNKAAILATAAAQKMTAAATALWTGAQKLLNMVLTANPIGMVITAVGALTTGVIYAYNHFEGFRKACMSVWEVIEPLANSLMNGLSKALGWVVEKSREAWEWLTNILGLDGKKAEVTVDLKAKKPDDIVELENKYKDFKPKTDGAKTGGRAVVMRAAKAEEPKEYNAYAKTLREIRTNIDILDEKILDSTKEQAAILLALKAAWEEEENAILNSGNALDENSESAEKNEAVWKDNAKTLRDIGGNIEILQEKLQNASSAEEAAMINKQIKAWEAKADAIKKAGIEAVKEGENIGRSMMRGWKGMKDMHGSMESITSAIKGNGDAWERLTGIVDGFIGLYESLSQIIRLIQLLTGVTDMQTVAEYGKAAAIKSTAAADTAATGIQVANATSKAAASGVEAAADTTAATAKVFKAHSWIPFVGVAMAAAMVASMIASISKARNSVPKFAKGGIASGPTLAMVGEYGGAASNPEVIAPLDKLRKLIGRDNGGVSGTVEFKIEGRQLVGILNKENNIRRRS